jgi:sialic acid synthase SpsE
LLGAVIIEKHFTHDKSLPGNDHYHAMDQRDLLRFVTLADTLHILLGSSDHKAPIATESISRKNARRSIVLARAVNAGHQFTVADLTCKRPGTGISPLHWDEVIHRRAAHAMDADHVMQWQDLAPTTE